VALGTQLVSVWKDSRVLGKSAAEFANMIADGKGATDIPGVAKFSGGAKGVEVNAVLIPPNPITKDNLGDVISAGWVTKEEACAGVAAGSVAACN
jgi:D-xylose transport system substrate-binding protein